MDIHFDFCIHQKVVVELGGFHGEIRHLSLDYNDAKSYSVRYLNGQGNLVEHWFSASELRSG